MRIFCTLLMSIFFTVHAFSQMVELPDQLEKVTAVVKVDNELYWMNESGHGFMWYITDLSGQLKDSTFLGQIENLDIEDMTLGKRGAIFIADVGNDEHDRKDLKVHKFDQEGSYKGAVQFSYPDQQLFPPASSARTYDSEALTYYDSNLHLFSKSNTETAGYLTKHYLIPVLPGNFTSRLMESIVLPESVVTSAAMSPNGDYLALLGYHFKKVLGIFPKTETTIFVFPVTNKNYFFNQPYKKYDVKSKGGVRYDAIEWLNNSTVIVAAGKAKNQAAHFQMITLDQTSN